MVPLLPACGPLENRTASYWLLKGVIMPHQKTHHSVHIRKLRYPRTTLIPCFLPIFSEWKRQASVMFHPPPGLPHPIYKKDFQLLQSRSQYLGGWKKKTEKLFTVSSLRLEHKVEETGLRAVIDLGEQRQIQKAYTLLIRVL